MASIRARRMLVSTGAAPSVEIAIVTGARSTIAGVSTSHISGRSTTLTGTRAERAVAASARSRSSSSVAMKASAAPAKSAASGHRAWTGYPSAAANAKSGGSPCGEKT
jgi:hypothetical protein